MIYNIFLKLNYLLVIRNKSRVTINQSVYFGGKSLSWFPVKILMDLMRNGE